jgi:hypothetical protein
MSGCVLLLVPLCRRGAQLDINLHMHDHNRQLNVLHLHNTFLQEQNVGQTNYSIDFFNALKCRRDVYLYIALQCLFSSDDSSITDFIYR